MKSKFDSEAALAAALLQALEQDDRKQVYQEVKLPGESKRADIVALLDGMVTVIECKLSPTFAAVKQARKWTDDAHHIGIAVPWIPDHEERELCIEICDKLKVGLTFVGDRVTIPRINNVPMVGRFNRNASSRLIDHLLKHGDDYKSGNFAAAGTKGGGHLTQQNINLQRLRDFLEHNAACPLKHAVSAIEHDWRTDAIARNEITKMLRKGGIPGVTYEVEGGITVLYPTTKEGALK